MHWYIDVLKKYAVFHGRARRKEYWMFVLINWIITLILNIIERAANLASPTGTGPLVGLYSLAVFLPALGVAIRRLHDTNRSGWWVLLALIPLVGWIWLIVLLALPGTQGPNKHGPDPKAAEAMGYQGGPTPA